MLVSHKMSRDSIYTIKLRRRGIDLGEQPPALGGTVADVMTQPVEVIPQALPVSALIERIRASSHSGFPVVDDEGNLVGLVTHAELREALANAADLRVALAVDLMRSRPPTCLVSEALPSVAAKMPT